MRGCVSGGFLSFSTPSSLAILGAERDLNNLSEFWGPSHTAQTTALRTFLNSANSERVTASSANLATSAWREVLNRSNSAEVMAGASLFAISVRMELLNCSKSAKLTAGASLLAISVGTAQRRPRTGQRRPRTGRTATSPRDQELLNRSK